jgi:hypothetical protein
VQAVVQYAGGAYGEVAGVLQLNVVVPSTVSGSALPIIVHIGNAASQAGVTIAVAANTSPGFAITSQETTGAYVAGSSGALTCMTPPAQSSFQTTDSRVWVFFAFSGAQSGDMIASNWVHPSGQVDAYQPSFTLNQAGGGCAALPLAIVGADAAQDPGNWQVKVFRNGTLEFALPFTIMQ